MPFRLSLCWRCSAHLVEQCYSSRFLSTVWLAIHYILLPQSSRSLCPGLSGGWHPEHFHFLCIYSTNNLSKEEPRPYAHQPIEQSQNANFEKLTFLTTTNVSECFDFEPHWPNRQQIQILLVIRVDLLVSHLFRSIIYKVAVAIYFYDSVSKRKH